MENEGLVKVNTNHYRAFTVLLERVRQKIEDQEEKVAKEGHTEEWEVICLQEIANFSGLPGDRVPLWEPHSVL